MWYNKYRPKNFKEVIGQETTVNTLRAFIEKKKLPQSILLTGIRGTGKTTIARILAKELNISPEDTHEIDGASNNSVDNIRNLNTQLRIPPLISKHKVYIIDEVHMLSKAAFNALLKNVEEPPKHVYFIFCTTEPEKVISTIRSRCLEFGLKTIPSDIITEGLQGICKKEKIKANKDALDEISNRSEGSMRDAITLLESCVQSKKLTLESISEKLNVIPTKMLYTLLQHLLNNNIPEAILIYQKIWKSGVDGKEFITNLGSYIRDILMSSNEDVIDLMVYSKTSKAMMIAQNIRFPKDLLIEFLDICYKYDMSYGISRNKRLHCEMFIYELYRKCKDSLLYKPKLEKNGKS